MEERIQKIIRCVVLVLILVLSTGTVIGAGIQKNISVQYGGVNIYIDGTKINPKDANGNAVEPIVYNGTTYLPVRAMSNAINKSVEWDEKTQTIYLGVKPGSTVYNRLNPAPLKTTQILIKKDYSYDYKVGITINEIIRGEEAWKLILKENYYNSPAPEGKEYIVAKIIAAVLTIGNDKAVSFSESMFENYSSDNVEYDQFFSVVTPSPAFSGNAFAGGILEGYVSFLVDKKDTKPKVVFEPNYDGSGGIWFCLY